MKDPRIESILRNYVKTSQVKAAPMTKTEHLRYLGLQSKATIEPVETDEAGFFVSVGDDKGVFDGPREGGGWHVTWVPKETFAQCYAPHDVFDFGHAMLMKFKGENVSRMPWGWNVFIVTIESGDISLTGDWVNGTRPWLGIHRCDGSIEPYTPTQEDMMANDWRVVTKEVTDFKKLGIPAGENWWR